MNELKIKSIKNGAEYDGAVWDFWITAVLESGMEIEIFDSQGLDLHALKEKWISADLEALFVETNEDPDLTALEGVISYKNEEYIFSNNEIEIVINDIDKSIALNIPCKFYFGRLDLLNYHLK